MENRSNPVEQITEQERSSSVPIQTTRFTLAISFTYTLTTQAERPHVFWCLA